MYFQKVTFSTISVRFLLVTDLMCGIGSGSLLGNVLGAGCQIFALGRLCAREHPALPRRSHPLGDRCKGMWSSRTRLQPSFLDSLETVSLTTDGGAINGELENPASGGIPRICAE